MANRDANPMADVYRRLSAVGLTRPFVTGKVLPEWWDDEIAEKPAGLSEALAYISRFTGLDFDSLRSRSATLAFRPLPSCVYKKSKSTTVQELSLASAMATRAAQLVLPGVPQPISPLPERASQIRDEILGMGEWRVGLRTLLDYCWMVGIPVIHLAEMPSGKRPHGLSAVIDGHPVIVLCKNDRHSAWLLFILAHELGHIVLSHVKNNEVILDEDVKTLGDQEEKQADAFAIELLTGSADRRYGYTGGTWFSAEELARLAAEVGLRDCVDPGHIILNYAHTMSGYWGVANAALDILEPDGGAVELVRAKLSRNLDWSRLVNESAEFIMRIAQAEY